MLIIKITLRNNATFYVYCTHIVLANNVNKKIIANNNPYNSSKTYMQTKTPSISHTLCISIPSQWHSWGTAAFSRIDAGGPGSPEVIKAMAANAFCCHKRWMTTFQDTGEEGNLGLKLPTVKMSSFLPSPAWDTAKQNKNKTLLFPA